MESENGLEISTFLKLSYRLQMPRYLTDKGSLSYHATYLYYMYWPFCTQNCQNFCYKMKFFLSKTIPKILWDGSRFLGLFWKNCLKAEIHTTDLDTVDSCYLEVEGTLKNSLRYPYFDISDVQNWGKYQLNSQISPMNM